MQNTSSTINYGANTLPHNNNQPFNQNQLNVSSGESNSRMLTNVSNIIQTNSHNLTTRSINCLCCLPNELIFYIGSFSSNLNSLYNFASTCKRIFFIFFVTQGKNILMRQNIFSLLFNQLVKCNKFYIAYSLLKKNVNYFKDYLALNNKYALISEKTRTSKSFFNNFMNELKKNYPNKILIVEVAVEQYESALEQKKNSNSSVLDEFSQCELDSCYLLYLANFLTGNDFHLYFNAGEVFHYFSHQIFNVGENLTLKDVFLICDRLNKLFYEYDSFQTIFACNPLAIINTCTKLLPIYKQLLEDENKLMVEFVFLGLLDLYLRTLNKIEPNSLSYVFYKKIYPEIKQLIAHTVCKSNRLNKVLSELSASEYLQNKEESFSKLKAELEKNIMNENK